MVTVERIDEIKEYWQQWSYILQIICRSLVISVTAVIVGLLDVMINYL